MIDLPADGGGALELLNLQHGSGLFDEHGNVAMDSDVIVDTIEWYIHQTRGENKDRVPGRGGQTLSKAMLDGFALFYFCPDWRTQTFEKDVPTLSGKDEDHAPAGVAAWRAADQHLGAAPGS
ncbi:MAG: hypothetical protein M5U09_25285, partial [Gammaproteobacteria bacterium]|nr:hypothetical protein [Gammaproteobacteria bacterium]